MTQTWTLFKFSDQRSISFIWKMFLELYMIVISVQQTCLLGFQFFHSTKFTKGVHVLWFLPWFCFCHLNFWSFLKLKRIEIKLYFQEYKRTEFNKTIIPFALVGYEIGYTISYLMRAHGIIVKYHFPFDAFQTPYFSKSLIMSSTATPFVYFEGL